MDLSTGTNRNPWPTGQILTDAMQTMPTARAIARLRKVAAEWFGCDPALILPVAGVSDGVQVILHLLPKGRAAVLSPTSDGHAADLRAAGWQVSEPRTSAALHGADLAVIANPNNPDGRTWQRAEITELARYTGHLIVDESFADPRPELSIAPTLPANVTVLRSVDRFWGLAGLRLGFVISQPTMIGPLSERIKPWTISGHALEIGAAAMADHAWAAATITWLAEAAVHLDQIMQAQGCVLIGGTHLFRLYGMGDAAAMQDRLARHRIRGQIFPSEPRWLCLGLPGNRAEFSRLRAALA